MLDDISTSANNDDLPRPPAGRRSATRPAGPPVAMPIFSDAGSAAEAGAALAQPPQGGRATRSSGKAATTRTTRSRSRAAAAAEPADVPPAPVKRVRSRGKAATPAAEPTVVEQAEPTLPVAEPAPEQEAPAEQRTTRTRRSTRTKSAPVDETPAAPVEDPLAAAIEAVKPVRSRRARGAVDAQAASALIGGEVPLDEHGEIAREQVLSQLAEAIAETPSPEGEARPGRGRRNRRTGAQAKDETVDEQASQAEPTDEEPSEDEAGESGSTRRRRRRGGRRRRKGEQGERESVEADEDEPSEEHDETDEDDRDASHRRRRRRRRRGEDASGADDDPSDVVVRVREPRGRASSGSDEVSGIEGSTRLEAKRQRRKESRAQGRRAPILTEAEFLARRESVTRVMVIRQRDEYSQIAVLEDGVLVEHYVDRASAASLIGSIYLGKVQNVLPGMEAAFIDIGRGRNAVLYSGEVDWDSFGSSGTNHKVEDVFSPGQAVLVQVSKDPVGAKGARLTGHVSLPGRYVIYSPDGQLSGISRKLPDIERVRLKKVLGDVVGDNASVIVRTAAEGASQEELVRDVDRLRAQWEVINKKVAQGNAPQLLYSEPDLMLRIVRDLFTEDFAQLVIAGNGGAEDAFDTVQAYVQHVAPHLADRLVRWDSEDKGDPFSQYRIDEQIAKALERKVFLPSGGSLVIDRTEAMTVIDVNTGKFTGSGGNLEETVTRNNLEAAEEIVRQLRLRDLGGIVVVDFIDMVLPSNRELLLRRLVECLGRDRTRHQVSEVTSLGLVQLTRKKIGTGLAEAFTEQCEACGGRGYVRHEEPIDSQAPADGGERKPARRGGGRRSKQS